MESFLLQTLTEKRMNRKNMRRLLPIMLAGTGSDVGKSLIATGLCRIFRQDGYSPAPFKAQNMALNSYATPDGLEIGRAQAVQAEAAGIPCQTDMNPILLKPSGHLSSQIVIHGRPAGNRDAYDYFRKEGREELRTIVNEAFDRLNARYNPVVMEGAGSISEINLRDSDLVNMPMARHAGAQVILVADIDRGGVFASVYGSIMLQSEDDRKRIKGIIINKFRGDLRLFEDGRKMMEDICGVPVLGVVPFAPDIHVEEEDSVALSTKKHSACEGKINVAVVLLRHISNFTDFDMLERHPNVNLFYTADQKDISEADIIIIPGTKSTIADLLYLRGSGLAQAIVKAYKNGKTVIGICGGYQIMGETVADPEGVEGEPATVPGLGILPCSTVMTPEKVTRQVCFRFREDQSECQGYEIHMGQTVLSSGASPVNMISEEQPDGCMAPDGKSFGSYIHGILDNGCVVESILSPFAGRTEVKFDYRRFKEEQYDKLADHLRRHIDIGAIYKILSEK